MIAITEFIAMWLAYLPPALQPMSIDGMAAAMLIALAIGVIGFGNFRGYRLWRHWMPWACVLLAGLIRNPDPTAAYRNLLYLMPIIVAWASYLTGSHTDQIRRLVLLGGKVSIVYIFLGALWTIYVSGVQTPWSFVRAGGAVTAVAIGIIVFTLETDRTRRWIWFSLAVLCPIVGLNRMASLVALLIPVMAYYVGKPSVSRTILSMAFGTAALALLISIPVVEQKMFYSGSGSLATFVDNPDDVRSHGRAQFWVAVYGGMQGMDWVIGHGANRASDAVAAAVEGKNHPHNDWLRIVYDFGLIGVLAFGYGLVREFRRLDPEIVGEYGLMGRTMICALTMLMVTGNVALYGVFYGNLIFILIGSCYRSAVVRAQQAVGRPGSATAASRQV